MLTQFRNLLDGKITKALLFLLMIMFVFGSGITIFFKDSSDLVQFKYAKDITKADLHLALILEHNKYEQQRIDNNLSKEEVINLALEDLTARRLIANFAEQIHFVPSNKYINNIIKHSPLFITDGKFDVQKFHQYLKEMNIGEVDYRQYWKEQIQQYFISELFTGVGQELGFEATKNLFEARKVVIYNKNLDEEISIEFDKIEIEELHDELIKLKDIYGSQIIIDANVNREKLEEHYIKHLRDYALPEQRSIKYTTIDDIDETMTEKLEDDITEGLTLDALAKKYNFSVSIVHSIIQTELPHILQPISKEVFNANEEFVSYPIDVKGKNIIYEVTNIAGGNVEKFEDIVEKVKNSYNKNQLRDFNTNLILLFDQYAKSIKEDHNLTAEEYETKLKNLAAAMNFNVETIQIGENNITIPGELYTELQQITPHSFANTYFDDQYGYTGYVLEITFDADQRNKDVNIKHIEERYCSSLFITELMHFLKKINHQ